VPQYPRKRPWLAALLAFVQPGLGHVYLRAWVRAVLWFGLWIATVLVVTPLPDAAGVVETLVAAMGAFGALSIQASLALVSVTVFSTLDAYWLADRTNRRHRTPETPRCPHCGNEVDADLEFCHWCTEPLEWEPYQSGGAGEESAAR
jgi:hypothetical protein